MTCSSFLCVIDSEIEDFELDDDIPGDVGVDQILQKLIESLKVTSQAEVGVEYLDKEVDELGN